MPRSCQTCQHTDVDAINRELAANTAIPALAAKYRVSADALLRHKQNHLPATLAKATNAADMARADDLLTQVQALKAKAVCLLLKAEAAGDYRTALAGVREARSCLELLLEVEGEVSRNPQVNILIASPAWLQTRDAILRALAGHPAARNAVVRELLALEVE